MQDDSQQQVQQPQEEQKKERIDELDIFGGMIIRMLQKFSLFIKGMFVPKKVE